MQRAPGHAVGLSRTEFALWLDALLLLLLLVVESPHLTGLAAHEAIGIAIAVPMVIHLLLSWHWIVSKAQRLFVSGTTRTRVNYLINIVLFIALVATIITGIVVSRVLLPAAGISTIFDFAWMRLHHSSSNVLFCAGALHLAMNWEWVVASLRRRSFPKGETKTGESEKESLESRLETANE